MNTFASIIVSLTAMTATAKDILDEIANDNAVIATPGLPNLMTVCSDIIHLDGEICEPVVPTHIRANLPIYKTEVENCRARLAAAIADSKAAFSADMQAKLDAAVAHHINLASDRFDH